MANILLTGIYPESDLDAIEVVLEFVASIQSDEAYTSDFEWNWREELSIGVRGKVGDMKLKISPKDRGSSPASPDSLDPLIDTRLKFIYNGPAIWDDEMFDPEYFERITAFQGPLDGICLVMKDWPPDGDYRLSRWLEWVTFYEEILAPTIDHEVDIYVLFLYKAQEDHMKSISATATTSGVRCFVVGQDDGMFKSGKSAIDSTSLSCWLMTLAVDVNLKETPSVPGTSTTFEEVITPGRNELDSGDPLAGFDLAAYGFNTEVEDDEEFEEPVLADLADDDPLAGINMAGFKLEYESDEEDDDEPKHIPTEIDSKRCESPTTEDEEDPPDTAEDALGERLGRPSPLNIQSHDLSKRKPMRLGQVHRFLRSIILDLKNIFKKETDTMESKCSSIRKSLDHTETRISNLLEDQSSSQRQYDSLFVSTRLISGKVVSRRHDFRLLDPSPRTFSFDEKVEFPIRDVKVITITGKQDPKIWGPDPNDLYRFIGKVKNDIYRSARCEFQLLGYEKDVLAQTIQDLDNEIKNLTKIIKECNDDRDSLKEELAAIEGQISEVEVRLWACDLDIAALDNSGSLAWNMTKMKGHLKEHNIYGIIQEYELCSYARMSFHSFDKKELTEYKSLLREQEEAQILFYAGLHELSTSLAGSETKTKDLLNNIGNLTDGLELKQKYDNFVKKNNRDLAQLKQQKRLWPPHISELEELAEEAKKMIEKLDSDRIEAVEATLAFQEKMKTEFSRIQGEPIVAVESAQHEANFQVEVVDQMKKVLDGELLSVGAYSTMKYHKTTQEGLLALRDGIASVTSAPTI
ncbi:hypothetical protein TWF694_004682 [Orbilia ellipsospora]|uniref:Uncharacterized protein n=1 Tax=Orbilia ellipsospora TaxID=2528407 RepID=A0AAV9WVW0_9PEZI